MSCILPDFGYMHLPCALFLFAERFHESEACVRHGAAVEIAAVTPESPSKCRIFVEPSGIAHLLELIGKLVASAVVRLPNDESIREDSNASSADTRARNPQDHGNRGGRCQRLECSL